LDLRGNIILVPDPNKSVLNSNSNNKKKALNETFNTMKEEAEKLYTDKYK